MHPLDSYSRLHILLHLQAMRVSIEGGEMGKGDYFIPVSFPVQSEVDSELCNDVRSIIYQSQSTLSVCLPITRGTFDIEG